MVPAAFRGAFYHISLIDQGAKVGFFCAGSGRLQPRRERLPARMVAGKKNLAISRQAVTVAPTINRASACCGRKVFARREWTNK
jgi:hypothetical protein